MGRNFAYALLTQLAEAESPALDTGLALADLIDRQLVERQPAGTAQFVHAVVHEVTYEGMLASERRRLHRLTARLLTIETDDESERSLATLAWHHEHAADQHEAVEAVVDGKSRPLRPMARRLLAVLAVTSGRVVRTEQVLCRLWPESLPATADKTLQSHVLHLRRALGPTAVAHRSGGYALDTSVVSVDSVRLEALVGHALRRVCDGGVRHGSC